MMPNKKEKRKAKAAAAQKRSVAELNEALLHASECNIVSSNDAKVMSAQAAIAAGADVNYSRDDRSCLMEASFSGHAEMVALLLSAGAERTQKEKMAARRWWWRHNMATPSAFGCC
jgi:ankyrin repeat protein